MRFCHGCGTTCGSVEAVKLAKLFGRGRGSEGPPEPLTPPAAPPARRPRPVGPPEGTPLELDRSDVAAAESLAAAGRYVEAVDALVVANRAERHPRIEIRLLELRFLAASRAVPGAGRGDWPPAYTDPFPGLRGVVPEIGAADLTSELMGGAVAHHGGLLVRGMFGAEQVARSVEAIERTHLRYRAELEANAEAGEELPPDHPGVPLDLDVAIDEAWYHPLRMPGVPGAGGLRKMVAAQGGTWLADSPSASAIVLDTLADIGFKAAIESHFGERPYFSLQKSTLRRSLPRHKMVAWHQDGSFLGEGVRTINVWVALSPCGGDRPSPGLEIVPRRFDEILPVVGDPTPHSVDYDLVDELTADLPTVLPTFDPGDGLVFDERYLHRTHLSPAMTEIRYALECWFFAPSHQATNYTPLLA